MSSIKNIYKVLGVMAVVLFHSGQAGPIGGTLCAAVVGGGCLVALGTTAASGVFSVFTTPLAGYCLAGLGDCAVIAVTPTP